MLVLTSSSLPQLVRPYRKMTTLRHGFILSFWLTVFVCIALLCTRLLAVLVIIPKLLSEIFAADCNALVFLLTMLHHCIAVSFAPQLLAAFMANDQIAAVVRHRQAHHQRPELVVRSRRVLHNMPCWHSICCL